MRNVRLSSEAISFALEHLDDTGTCLSPECHAPETISKISPLDCLNDLVFSKLSPEKPVESSQYSNVMFLRDGDSLSDSVEKIGNCFRFDATASHTIYRVEGEKDNSFVIKEPTSKDRPNFILNEYARYNELGEHPNFLSCHDIIVSPTDTGLVLEYFKGVSLEKLRDLLVLTTKSKEGVLNTCFPDEKAISELSDRARSKLKAFCIKRLFTSLIHVCNGLDHMKSHDMVHRDVKPANILISSNPNDVKLIDLSFACDVGHQDSAFCGTFGYVSREQFSSGILTTKSDIYSLGKVIFSILTTDYEYSLPYKQVDPFATDASLVSDEFGDEFCDSIDRLCVRMTDEDPEKRPDLNEVKVQLSKIVSIINSS